VCRNSPKSQNEKVSWASLAKKRLNTVDEGLDSKRENSDFVGTQFVIQENKLILVGGNEIDDYYIKIVE
jgi:hypothetical protein